MSERRRHVAEGGEAGHVHELGLKFLQAGFGLLTLGQVADEAGEIPLPGGTHLADRELHREGRAILALADHDAADADDPLLAGREIAPDIAVMLRAIRVRHQHLDVLADDFAWFVTELPNRRGAERLGRGPARR